MSTMKPATPSAHVTRRHFLKWVGAIGATVSAGPLATGYALNVEPTMLQVEHGEIRLRRLPGAFEGVTIAQLSDLHLGPYVTEDYIARAVQMTNALKPD